MASLGQYLLSNVQLSAHCVDAHGGTLYLQSVEKTRDGRDLVILVPHLLLTDEQRVLGHDDVEQVSSLRSFLPGRRAAELLAVDGYLLLLKDIQYTSTLLDDGLLQKVGPEGREQPLERMRRGIAVCVREQTELPGPADAEQRHVGVILQS